MTRKKAPRNTPTKITKKKATKAVAVKERKTEKELKKYSTKDPRQTLFLQLYYDNHSPTWGNAKQSAIASGYSENVACQITYKMPKWWLDFIRQQDVSGMIEKHIAEVLNLPTVTQVMGAFGPITQTETVQEEVGVYKTGPKKGQPKFKKKKIKVPVMQPNMQIIKEKTAVSKLAAPAHNPDMYGKKMGGTNNFTFNMTPDRQKYS